MMAPATKRNQDPDFVASAPDDEEAYYASLSTPEYCCSCSSTFVKYETEKKRRNSGCVATKQAASQILRAVAEMRAREAERSTVRPLVSATADLEARQK